MNNHTIRKPWKILVSILFIVILQAFTFQSPTASNDAQGEQGLFTDASQRASLDVSSDPTIARTRYVEVNFDMLNGAEVGDTVLLNLYEGLDLLAILESKESLHGGGYTWLGHLEGIDFSQVILVIGGGQMAGNVTMPGGFYQVRWAGNGVHAIYTIDQSQFPDEAEPTLVELSPEAIAAADENSMLDDGSVIDVLVVYSDDARAAAGGTTAIQNTINLAVAETNVSYANSNINTSLNLVHMEEVAYSETGDVCSDRTRLRNPSDGHIDNVHTLRDTYNADMVALIIENDVNYCGCAYIMDSVSTAFENYAFQATKRTCATGYYSFGHEFGHIQSARHDWYVDDTAFSPYSYNHAFVYVPGDWRTVMAYNNECADNGTYCTRLQYWSNPNILYGGVAMGVPAGTSTSCTAWSHPNCDADNHLTLNNTALTVANFRSATPPGPIIYWGRTVDDDNLDNSSGNDDGYIDCGETIELYVDLYNNGAGAATNVYATISSTDPYISFLFNTSSSYGDIAAAATETNINDFDFSVDPATPHGHYIGFNLDITASNGGPWSDSFSVPVFCLSPDAYEPDDSSAAATTINDGVPQTHNIYPVGDEDWVTFTLAQESGVLLETSGPSGDSRMWLYDSGLTELEYNDDGGAGLWSRIDRVCGVDALPAGTYYVKIDEYGDNYPIEAYDINYTITGPCETPPDINVTPASLSVVIPINGSTTEFLTIENLGGGPLSYSISDEETGSPAQRLRIQPGAGDGPDAPSTDDVGAFPQPVPAYGADIAAPAVNPVLIIQDTLPWGYDAIQSELTANGIAYDEVDSSQIATIDLSPYEMVVIPSVQGDVFYNALNANIAKFESYVNGGGKLWQSTCN
ncbi:MAG: zinc-dependent metalloprotease family protein, partial [Anaerolineales bacterium]